MKSQNIRHACQQPSNRQRACCAKSADWRHLRNLRSPNFFQTALLGPDPQQTSVSSLLFGPVANPHQLDKMRVSSFVRAQSLASSTLRISARSTCRIPARCALSTATASRTPYTNGTKTSAWICRQQAQLQRRWQSAAAQVYVAVYLELTALGRIEY
jgi:hypothetical protein